MVKELPIHNKPEMITLVDDDDFPLLSRYSWTLGGQASSPYLMTNMIMANNKRCVIYLHKLIMGGFSTCDHINGDRLDNRKENLRRATMQENAWNSIKRTRTAGKKLPTSQYKGVSKCVGVKGRIYWRVMIKLTMKGVKPEKFARLGPFTTEIEAAHAYNEEIVKHRGEWAYLNKFPEDHATNNTEDGK